jgi:hypothetical protein
LVEQAGQVVWRPIIPGSAARRCPQLEQENFMRHALSPAPYPANYDGAHRHR